MYTCKSFFLFSLRILLSRCCFGWWWTSKTAQLRKVKKFWKISDTKMSCNISGFIFFFSDWLVQSCQFWKRKLLHCFLMFRRNTLYSSLCLWLLVVSLATLENNVALSSLNLPFRYLYTLIRCPLILFFFRLDNPSSLSLSSKSYASAPS